MQRSIALQKTFNENGTFSCPMRTKRQRLFGRRGRSSITIHYTYEESCESEGPKKKRNIRALRSPTKRLAKQAKSGQRYHLGNQKKRRDEERSHPVFLLKAMELELPR